MRKVRIFLGILITLLILPVLVSAGSIPEPPHLGLWIERDGKLLTIKAIHEVYRAGVSGFPIGQELSEGIFIIKKTDRIIFFSGHNPDGAVRLSYLKFVDVIGNAYSGMHRIDLFVHNLDIPFKVNPLGSVRGVPIFEILIDYENDFWLGQCAIHVGQENYVIQLKE